MTELSIESLSSVPSADLLNAEPLDLKIRDGVGLYSTPEGEETDKVVSRLRQSFADAAQDCSREYCSVLAYCLLWQEDDETTKQFESVLVRTASEQSISQQTNSGHEATNELWSGRDNERLYRIHRHAGLLVLDRSRGDDPDIFVEQALTYSFQSHRI